MLLSFTSDWKPAAACPAAWHAQRVAGEYQPERKECFATGSLFHATLLTPERVPAVYAEYGDMLTLTRASKTGQKGEPNAAARDAIADATYARSLPDVADLLDGGRCETEVLFDLDGIPWIAHIDLITANGSVVDVKTASDLHKLYWNPAEKLRNAPWWNDEVQISEGLLYWHQLAVYRRALGGPADRPVGIIAVRHRDGKHPHWHIIQRDERDDDILNGYASDVVWSMRHDWNSPITGERIPPFADMLDMPSELAQAILPHCGQCDWCIETQDPYVTYAARRERGL
jgi:hypothetical protein